MANKGNKAVSHEAFIALVNAFIEQAQLVPYFREIELSYTVAPQHRSVRIPTTLGNVMYFPSTNRWQFKAYVWDGTMDVFIKWLKHFVQTGESLFPGRKAGNKNGQLMPPMSGVIK